MVQTAKDWRRPDDKFHLPNEAYQECLNKFEEFLESTGVCFFAKQGWLFEDHQYSVLYTVFAKSDSNNYDYKEVSKFDILVRPLKNKRIGPACDQGYMIVVPSEFTGRIAPAQLTSTLYCNYYHAEQIMIFKPANWVAKYLKAAGEQPRTDLKVRKENREVYMRLDVKQLPDEVKPIDSANPSMMASQAPRLKAGDMFHLRDFQIPYSGNLVITQEDLKTFLMSHNTYPDMWKLKFKVLKNILAKEI
jgi:hypothetical protein